MPAFLHRSSNRMMKMPLNGIVANPSCLLSILLFSEILGNKTVSLEHPA
jgi:hypothetical protein